MHEPFYLAIPLLGIYSTESPVQHSGKIMESTHMSSNRLIIPEHMHSKAVNNCQREVRSLGTNATNAQIMKTKCWRGLGLQDIRKGQWED